MPDPLPVTVTVAALGPYGSEVGSMVRTNVAGVLPLVAFNFTQLTDDASVSGKLVLLSDDRICTETFAVLAELNVHNTP